MVERGTPRCAGLVHLLNIFFGIVTSTLPTPRYIGFVHLLNSFFPRDSHYHTSYPSMYWVCSPAQQFFSFFLRIVTTTLPTPRCTWFVHLLNSFFSPGIVTCTLPTLRCAGLVHFLNIFFGIVTTTLPTPRCTRFVHLLNSVFFPRDSH